jgi:HNH endonuclease
LENLRALLLERIVEHPGPLDNLCWIWTWGHNGNGYGNMRWRGKVQLAHRLSYMAFVGSVPDELDCLHHCDVRDCIRPDHLYLGTDQDNQDDMYRRGRGPLRVGDANGRATLTNEQIAEVKWLALEGLLSQFQIADLYGIDQTTVSRAKLGKNWKDVEPKAPPIIAVAIQQPLIRRV